MLSSMAARDADSDTVLIPWDTGSRACQRLPVRLRSLCRLRYPCYPFIDGPGCRALASSVFECYRAMGPRIFSVVNERGRDERRHREHPSTEPRIFSVVNHSARATRRPHDRPSMEPRNFQRGEPEARLGTRLAMNPSMEPRTFSVDKLGRTACGTSSSWSFNGATPFFGVVNSPIGNVDDPAPGASMEPRILSVVNTADSTDAATGNMLRWSHAFSVW